MLDRIIGWMREITLAISFLTVLPVPTIAYQPGALGRSGRWFPLVGLIIGLILVGTQWLLTQLFPPFLVATLVTALWAFVTGGLHLDGLADCCDGLFAPVAPERRLEIMRDPRTGAFAVIGLVLFLLLKSVSIATVVNIQPALLLAPSWARWLLLWIARQPSARASGLGAEFRETVTPKTLWIASVVPLMLMSVFPSWQTLLALLGGLTMTWLLNRVARTRLGGTTGDLFGLTVELSELIVLLCFAIQFAQ